MSARVADSSGVQTVTLAVTPDDANALVLAKGQGQLQLTLRNTQEKPSSTAPKRATLDELLNLEPAADPPAPPKPFVAEVYRGGSREELLFDPVTGRPVPREQSGSSSSSQAARPEVTPNSAPARSSGGAAEPSKTPSGSPQQG